MLDSYHHLDIFAQDHQAPGCQLPYLQRSSPELLVSTLSVCFRIQSVTHNSSFKVGQRMNEDFNSYTQR